MSQERIERIRRFYEAWNVGGFAASERHWHEQAEWHDPPQLIGAEVYRGRAAIAAHMREFEPGGRGFRLLLDAEQVIEAGDAILVVLRGRGRGDSSGAPVADTPIFHVINLADGKVARLRVFLDRGQALEAAGLRE
jgi:ketosteroid isomerase-like protein